MPDRVVICGSRDWTDVATIRNRIATLPGNAVVITGGARGADQIAEIEARVLGRHVAVVKALWASYGKSAGHKRNVAMLALEPDYVIAFWDGRSPGTKGTIAEAARLDIPVEIHDSSKGKSVDE